MDVQVDADFIRLEREKRAWSQEHLAGAAGIGVRTIQRIEATGVASYESVRAISAVLEVPLGSLRRDDGSSGGVVRVRRRLGSFVRWIGAAAALAVLALSSGFFLLKDYQKVRVLRTVEQWVTDPAPSLAREPTQDGL